MRVGATSGELRVGATSGELREGITTTGIMSIIKNN